LLNSTISTAGGFIAGFVVAVMPPAPRRVLDQFG
jgi:hypothetical protein